MISSCGQSDLNSKKTVQNQNNILNKYESICRQNDIQNKHSVLSFHWFVFQVQLIQLFVHPPAQFVYAHTQPWAIHKMPRKNEKQDKTVTFPYAIIQWMNLFR